MKISDNITILNAHDLVGHLNCRHLTQMDVAVAAESVAKPDHWDPVLDTLRERGLRHEQAYLEHLAAEGYDGIRIDVVDITEDAVDATLDAMHAGADIIIQAALRSGRWEGRADVLMKVDKPSNRGNWSYEIVDTN